MRSAAIVGGGLATAIHLRHNGWRVDVLERAATHPTTGTALGIWPAALKALDTLGVGATVRTIGRAQSGAVFLRPDGSRIGAIDSAALERRSGDAVHLISRPALLGVLAAAAGPLRFGVEAPDVRELAGYDVVVGADGLHSRVRDALFGPGFRPRYTGHTVWRGAVPADLGVTAQTLGRGAIFGITGQEGGRTNWFATAHAPEGQREPGNEVAALKERFGHWHEDVRAVLDLVTEDEVLHHDLHHLDPPLPSYVTERVALIGDAAHAMTPDLGRGACEAIVDGLSLAEQLVHDPDVALALASYDRERRPPTQRLARMSRLMNRAVGVRRCLPLRDAALGLVLRFGRPPA